MVNNQLGLDRDIQAPRVSGLGGLLLLATTAAADAAADPRTPS